jgi:hypothetical protein
MKKNILLLIALSLIFSQSVANAEFDDDFWDAPMQIDQEAKSQQKTVTDKEFEKVMSVYEKNSNIPKKTVAFFAKGC